MKSPSVCCYYRPVHQTESESRFRSSESEAAFESRGVQRSDNITFIMTSISDLTSFKFKSAPVRSLNFLDYLGVTLHTATKSPGFFWMSLNIWKRERDHHMWEIHTPTFHSALWREGRPLSSSYWFINHSTNELTDTDLLTVPEHPTPNPWNQLNWSFNGTSRPHRLYVSILSCKPPISR